MADPSDNVELNPGTGGATIATENQPLYGQRGSSDVPATAYELPRSKIAVGTYGVDAGDASRALPFPVQTFGERQFLELMLLSQLDTARMAQARRGRERIPTLCDRGGGR